MFDRFAMIEQSNINRKYNRLSSIETWRKSVENLFPSSPNHFPIISQLSNIFIFSQIFSPASYPSKPLGGTIPIKAREDLGVMVNLDSYIAHSHWTACGFAAFCNGDPPAEAPRSTLRPLIWFIFCYMKPIMLPLWPCDPLVFVFVSKSVTQLFCSIL